MRQSFKDCFPARHIFKLDSKQFREFSQHSLGTQIRSVIGSLVAANNLPPSTSNSQLSRLRVSELFSVVSSLEVRFKKHNLHKIDPTALDKLHK